MRSQVFDRMKNDKEMKDCSFKPNLTTKTEKLARNTRSMVHKRVADVQDSDKKFKDGMRTMQIPSM